MVRVENQQTKIRARESGMRQTGSWFQRHGEAYRKEWSVIHKEDDADGQETVTRNEEQVLQGGLMVIRLRR